MHACPASPQAWPVEQNQSPTTPTQNWTAAATRTAQGANHAAHHTPSIAAWQPANFRLLAQLHALLPAAAVVLSKLLRSAKKLDIRSSKSRFRPGCTTTKNITGQATHASGPCRAANTAMATTRGVQGPGRSHNSFSTAATTPRNELMR